MNMIIIPETAKGTSFILPPNQIPISIEVDEITSRISPQGLVKNVKSASFWLLIIIEDMEFIFPMSESLENATAKDPLILMIMRIVHNLMPKIPVQQIALFPEFFNYWGFS